MFLHTNNSRTLNENTNLGTRNLIRVYLKLGREMLLPKKQLLSSNLVMTK